MFIPQPPPTPVTSTLALHDALPIWMAVPGTPPSVQGPVIVVPLPTVTPFADPVRSVVAMPETPVTGPSNKIERAHVCTTVTFRARMLASAPEEKYTP